VKVIIAGSRLINDDRIVDEAINLSQFKITEVVSGMCYGVDLIGRTWAQERNIPIEEFPAKWQCDNPQCFCHKPKQFHPEAGPIRNQQMARYANALILIWNGKSRGSRSMLKEAERAGIKIYEYITDEQIRITR
jgi:hypothetical protein